MSQDLQRKTVEVNGVKLSYLQAGAGETVLLWHGFLGTSHVWRKMLPMLAERYTVIAPDMRGYGDSDKPENGYDGLTLAQDFRLLIQDVRPGPVHIIAHDMGAPPALIWAAEYPKEVRTLTYIDEPVITSECLQQVFGFSTETWEHGKGGLWWWPFAYAGDMAERLIVGREQAYLEWFFEMYCATAGAIDHDATQEYLRSFSGVTGVKGAFGVYRSVLETMRQTDALVAQGKVKTPVLALGGEKSLGAKAKSMMETVADHVEGGAIAGCGHFIPEEMPAELVRRWDAFVAKA